MTSIRIIAILTFVLGLGPAGTVLAGEFVGIPDQEFATYYRTQRASEWCWASCIEMAMAFNGIDLPQEQVVAHTLGDGVNLGGKPSDMVTATSGLFRTRDGAPIQMAGQYLGGPPSPDVLYNHLQQGSPAIVLYKRSDGAGHAVLLTGMKVINDPERGVTVQRLHVFDPDSLGPLRIYAAVADHGGVAIDSAPIDGVVLLESIRLGRH